jgi:adenylate kinase family enzyme
VQRIVIIGSGGAGKSTLARQLGADLGIPVHHLDKLFWRPGWVKSPPAEFAVKQEAILREPAWIIDGNFGETIQARLRAADTILFLDLPTWVCLWGAVRRYIQYRNRTRPDMTEGNHEKLSWDYLWWILSYRTVRRPRVRARLKELAGLKAVTILRSRGAVQDFLKSMKPAGGSARPPV